MILLADPSGPLSRLVAHHLKEIGEPYLLLARDGREARSLEGQPGVRRWQAHGRGLREVLHNVDRILMEGMPRFGQSSRHKELIKASSGIRSIVRVSPHGASAQSASAYLRAQAVVDETLDSASVRSVVLRPHLYTQDLLAFAASVRDRHRIVACMGSGKASYVDARDVAHAAVHILTRAGPHRGIIELTGAHPMGLDEVAGILARLTGHPVLHQDVMPDELRQLLMLQGGTKEKVDAQVDLQTHYRLSPEPADTDMLARITGIVPRTVEGFLMEHAHRFTTEAAPWVLPDHEAVRIEPVSW